MKKTNRIFDDLDNWTPTGHDMADKAYEALLPLILIAKEKNIPMRELELLLHGAATDLCLEEIIRQRTEPK